MALFSQMKGFKPINKIIQIDSIDEDLIKSLWNVWYISYWNIIEFPENVIGLYKTNTELSHMRILIQRLWIDYFKKPLDTLHPDDSFNFNEIKNHFFDCKWYEVYDFIEFTAKNYPNKRINQNFREMCNETLKLESSAYRFVGKEIIEITSEEEIKEIEEALEVAPNPSSVHLKQALILLSDRKSPDYRNSIKESISAIESICKLITKNPKGTLGRCLNVIGDDVELYSALKEAFKKLYGYMGDAEGIRHSLMDESNLDFEDAKFMLVSCSAFTNYLMAKAAKSEIEL
jgi:hypothetical protein